MIKQIGDDILITQGDTAQFNVQLNIDLVPGDSIIMSVKQNYAATYYMIHKVVSTFTDNTAVIKLLSSDTNIPVGNYVYDIEYRGTDGTVSTIVTGDFIITEGVTANA